MKTWHGTPNGYQNKRCRCEDCKSAMREYSRARKKAVLQGVPSACDLCSRSDRRLVWDHDHDTMKSRGWICHQCNTGLGLLGDTEFAVLRALDYLEEFYEEN